MTPLGGPNSMYREDVNSTYYTATLYADYINLEATYIIALKDLQQRILGRTIVLALLVVSCYILPCCELFVHSVQPVGRVDHKFNHGTSRARRAKCRSRAAEAAPCPTEKLHHSFSYKRTFSSTPPHSTSLHSKKTPPH